MYVLLFEAQLISYNKTGKRLISQIEQLVAEKPFQREEA